MMFKCPIPDCDRSYKFFGNLKGHVHREHPVHDHCPICGKPIANRISIHGLAIYKKYGCLDHLLLYILTSSARAKSYRRNRGDKDKAIQLLLHGYTFSRWNGVKHEKVIIEYE